MSKFFKGRRRRRLWRQSYDNTSTFSSKTAELRMLTPDLFLRQYIPSFKQTVWMFCLTLVFVRGSGQNIRSLSKLWCGFFYYPYACRPTTLKQHRINIGIKHSFPCINVCQVPRETLRTEAVGRGFQHLPRDLANVNVLENNVWSLSLHKVNDLFVKIWETIWHYILSPFGCQRASAHFLNIRLPGPSAPRDPRWLSSFDSTSIFRKWQYKVVTVQL